MMSSGPEAALASRIAWRSEPGPESFVLVTTKIPEAPESSSMIREHGRGLEVDDGDAGGAGFERARLTVSIVPPTSWRIEDRDVKVLLATPGVKMRVPVYGT